jgi:cobalt-zinc-cadmium resistance protein CzcA
MDLKISDINKVVNTAFAGQSTGLVFEGEKTIQSCCEAEY